jgi:hypothetical protein
MEEEVSFLGYKWSKRGVRILDDPIQKLLSIEEPKFQTELRSFLGLASYIGATNIPHYSSLVEPLWKLCGAATWRWNEEARLQWQKLRNQIKCISRRTLFDPTKPVVVQSDASPSGFGAVMLQNSNPVLYASRKLTSAERNYSQIEKEASATLYAMKRFSIFLLGRNFTLQTDHQPLLQLWKKSPDEMSTRLTRIFLAMHPFSVQWQYIRGKDNTLADALSRLEMGQDESNGSVPKNSFSTYHRQLWTYRK